MGKISKISLKGVGYEIEDEVAQQKALQADTLHASYSADKVFINGRTLDTAGIIETPITPATSEKAGVMSATDKSFVDSLSQSKEVSDIEDAILLIVGKSDGTFVRVSPSVLRDVTQQYLTKTEYDELVAIGGVKENVEYNIVENE